MSTNPKPVSEDYSADTIQHLKGIDGIRHRPAMYIGGTDLAGLHHLVYEVTDNVLDEYANGFASVMNVQINGDGSVTVSDDGRGIPVDLMKETGKPAAEVVFTEIHAGGKFDRKAYAVGTGGLHGVGVTAVNALSEWLEVEICRQGFQYNLEFAKGRLSSPLTKGAETTRTGTKVTFKPDGTIFPNTVFNYDTIHKRLQDYAFLNGGIHINVQDERSGQSDSFCYQDGLAEFVKWINRTETPIHPDVIRIEGVIDAVQVDIALQWNEGYSEAVRCFANGISNSEGGTHFSGFKTALTRSLNNYGKAHNLFKDMNPSGDDFREGLAAVVTVRIPNPQFEAQTKIKLTNPEVDGAVNSIAGDVLTKFLEENPSIAKNICQKGLRAAEAREAARKARDMARSQNKVSGGGLPEKLRDCRNHGLDVSELYLVEGDSAGGSADQGRDSATQAVLPLRGKILNVEKAQILKVLANTEVTALFKAIGILPLAEEVDVAKRRYGKIILMTDADVDGSHIRTLLLTFIFRHMRELLKQGCVYVAQPPLYRVIARGKKPRYVQTHEEMMDELLGIGIGGASLVIHPRESLIGSTTVGTIDRREISGEQLLDLAEALDGLAEPIESLERRGISLRRMAIEHTTADGMLPRFRAFRGTTESWFATREELDAYISEQKLTEVSETPAAPVDGAAEGPDASVPDTITKSDLFEVRTINQVLKALQEKFQLSLNDLIAAPPKNAEQVYPYEIIGHSAPRRLLSLRELVPALRELGAKSLTYTRFKGLGEMNHDELAVTAMEPATRLLKRVTLDDAAAAEEIFRVLMGDHVEPRREFIDKHALDVKDLDI
ncbi:DNA gyrase subunit B [Planctomicrobium sp. SH668]|uniref:DNA gyrase subunit B n=1 Tax=Planctomicrobium sp. SH668 TaxID=3448126 RepID=UPI003F5C8B09